MSDRLPDVKTAIDTANSAIKLLEPFLQRAERWRFGQRLVTAIALITLAVSLIFGISDSRYIVAVVFLVMGVSFLTREPTWVTARHIAIKDEKGEIKGIWTVADGEPTLAFIDNVGEPRLRCGLNGEGKPSISLHDSAVQPRAMLMSDPVSGPAFVLADKKGRTRLHLTLASEGQGIVGLINETGQPTLLASGESDRAFIAGRDATGKLLWTLPQSPSIPAEKSTDLWPAG
jgi:hypothetical protein